MELKDKCKETRNSLGLSQAKFARLIGSTQTEVSFIERGFIPPHTQKISAIERLFKECIL